MYCPRDPQIQTKPLDKFQKDRVLFPGGLPPSKTAFKNLHFTKKRYKVNRVPEKISLSKMLFQETPLSKLRFVTISLAIAASLGILFFVIKNLACAMYTDRVGIFATCTMTLLIWVALSFPFMFPIFLAHRHRNVIIQLLAIVMTIAYGALIITNLINETR